MRTISKWLPVTYAVVLMVLPVFSQAGVTPAVPLEELKARAQAGDVMAVYAVAQRLHLGEGVARDDAAAVKWYQQAATDGLADAQFMMGMMFENGWGVEKNEHTATGWYRQAAEQNYASATSALGARYANGVGVQKDEVAATSWYMHAAELGDVSAQYHLAMRYATGLGVTNDFGEAARWCRKAAEQGDASAQFSLAMLYADGHAVPPEPETSLTWFRKAAEQNHVTAEYCLGYRLVHGGKGKRTEKEGAQWLAKAADAGDASAQYELGNLYTKGIGVKQSPDEALKWFLVSGALGNTAATGAAAGLEKELAAPRRGEACQKAQEILTRFKPGAMVMSCQKAAAAKNPEEAIKETPKSEETTPPAPVAKPVETNSAAEKALATPGLDQLEAEVKKSPTNYPAALNLALAYLQRQQTNLAVATLNQVVSDRVADRDADAMSAIARMYVWAGSPPKLETTLEKIVKIQPQNPDAWYELAAARAVMQKEPESLMALKTAVGLSKKRLAKDPQARDILAEARIAECFGPYRNTTAFKKIVPPVEN